MKDQAAIITGGWYFTFEGANVCKYGPPLMPGKRKLEEIAGLARFILSENAAYLIGEVVIFDEEFLFKDSA